LGYQVSLRTTLGRILSRALTFMLTPSNMVQPYPANLMVGFYARADATQPIRTDLDKELAGMQVFLSWQCPLLMIIDARWFTRAEIQSVLDHPTGTTFGRAEYKKMAESTEGRVRRDNKDSTVIEDIKIEGPPFKLPPITAIAGILIRDWATRKIGFAGGDSGTVQSLPKGHL
jgi:NAD+ diphosphatase